jgi:photosystem II stability/assembly factor-like uncharacterized protein
VARSYVWHQSILNGGGFIAGLLQDPQQPQTLYARADVAGVFKSVDGGKTWAAKNHGMTAYHQHDVRSFALSPHQPQLLFRASGSVRGWRCFGTIHKSTDGGDDWTPVCRDVDFYGNGETRQYGEVLQVDPHRPEVVIAGGYSAGLWISRDTGDHWTYAGLRDERISCVCFHPERAGVIRYSWPSSTITCARTRLGFTNRLTTAVRGRSSTKAPISASWRLCPATPTPCMLPA